jgi:hypothetical protein
VGGFVIDIVVAYLYKSLVRLFEYVESARWKKTSALIVESSVLDPDIGCPSVRIRYRQIDAEPVAEEEVPFFWRPDARRFSEKFPPGRQVTVRVHPEHPTITRFFGMGQK